MDQDALPRACLQQLQKQVQKAIRDLLDKKSYKTPTQKSGSKTKQQTEILTALKASALSKSTLPNGIIPVAARLVYGNTVDISVAMKASILPKDGKGRLTLWRDVVQSMLYHLWASEWKQQTDEPVLADPFTNDYKGGKDKYLKLLKEDEADSEDEGDADNKGEGETDNKGEGETDNEDEGGEDEGEAGGEEEDAHAAEKKKMRTCTASFSQCIRGDMQPQHRDVVRRKIEDAQASVTRAMSEMHILVHLVTLAIAAGAAYTAIDGPKPTIGFDLGALIPEKFQPEGFKPTLDVAPISKSLQESMEIMVKGPRHKQDDRCKLLTYEHLSMLRTDHLSPRKGGQSVAKGRHPVWGDISQTIRGTGYQGQCSTKGLTVTIAQHLRQLAVATDAMWKGSLYKKMFKNLVINVLRLWLAPQEFEKNQAESSEKAATQQAKTVANRAVARRAKMCRSKWRLLLARRFNELGKLVRNDQLDDRAQRRLQGIDSALRRLRKLKPGSAADVDRKPIAKLEERKRAAVAEVAGNDVSADDGDGDDDGDDDDDDWDDDDDGDDDDDDWDDDDDGMDDDDDGIGDNDDDGGDGDDEGDGEDEDLAANVPKSPPRNEDEQSDNDDSDDGNNSSDSMTSAASNAESSAKQIGRLFTVVNTLVHSSAIDRPINNNYVKKSIGKHTKCSTKELTAARKLVNMLRPFAPKRVATDNGSREHSGHVVLCAPMVLIAQAFFKTMGLSGCQRRMAPQVATGSTMSLQLSSAALYEILGSSDANQFTIVNSAGREITSVAEASNPANKEAVCAAFFDLDRLKQICLDHNIVFQNRLVFVDAGRVRLQGTLIPNAERERGRVVQSHYLERTARNPWAGSGILQYWAVERRHWESKGMDQAAVAAAAENAAAVAKAKETELKEHKKSKKADSRKTHSLQNELLLARKEGYYWAKVEQAYKRKQEQGSDDGKAPTLLRIEWDDHQMEEAPSHIDIQALIDGVRDDPRKVVAFGGGDPGIRTMLESVPQTLDQVESHLNRFHALYDLDDTQDTGQDTEMVDVGEDIEVMDTDDPSLFGDQASKEEIIPLPKATRSTAKYLQGVSYTNELMA
ncbi:hypothetical protein DFQ27_003363, partial [Actinomortierella ambigua]